MNESIHPDIGEVVQLVTTYDARGAEADTIDRRSHLDRRAVMRLDPVIMLDELRETDPLILLSHSHAPRIVRGVLIRKLVVTDRQQAMMTEITLIVMTEIVTADDVEVAGDPDGDASLIRTTIPLMTVMTVTGPVLAVHQNLTG